MMEQAIVIDSDFIRLDALMKLANWANSGGEAKHLIQEGGVRVNGTACLERSKKIRPGDRVSFAAKTLLVTRAAAVSPKQ
ncbi:hypothetical protein ABB02_00929 [Clostridiaceae bacterium JG1575]|nr:hypothetical protein ABB02_00929 [Clostridiaceae bacterium JG1575]